MSKLFRITIILCITLLLFTLSACNKNVSKYFFKERPENNEDVITPDNATTIEKNIMRNNNKYFESLKPKTEAIPKSGIYDKPIRIKLISSNKNAKIFYSTNMRDYDISHFSEYETPILIDKDTSIRYYSIYKGYQENVHENSYKIVNHSKKNKSSSNNDDKGKTRIRDYIRQIKISTPNKD